MSLSWSLLTTPSLNSSMPLSSRLCLERSWSCSSLSKNWARRVRNWLFAQDTGQCWCYSRSSWKRQVFHASCIRKVSALIVSTASTCTVAKQSSCLRLVSSLTRSSARCLTSTSLRTLSSLIKRVIQSMIYSHSFKYAEFHSTWRYPCTDWSPKTPMSRCCTKGPYAKEMYTMLSSTHKHRITFGAITSIRVFNSRCNSHSSSIHSRMGAGTSMAF